MKAVVKRMERTGRLVPVVRDTNERTGRLVPVVRDTNERTGRLVPVVRGTDDRTLRSLSGVGRSIEANLLQLGINTVNELAKANGDDLYGRLGKLEGRPQDPCVLDTFRCAVAQARDAHLPPEKRNWWWWSRQRKSGLLPS